MHYYQNPSGESSFSPIALVDVADMSFRSRLFLSVSAGSCLSVFA